jgi:hypothetical protein
MSATGVAPKTLHKNLKILNLTEELFSNTERATVF